MPLPTHFQGLSGKRRMCFWRWSHIWDLLLCGVELGGWSGLQWHSQGHLGSPASNFPAGTHLPSSSSLTPHSSYSQFPSRTSQGLLCTFGDRWTSLGNWRNYKLYIYRKAQSISSFLPYLLICKMGIRALSHLLHKVLHKVEKL